MSVKPLLDRLDEAPFGRFALAAFSDLSRAITKSIFPDQTGISRTSFTLEFAKKELKGLRENSEEFAYGYLSAHRAIKDAFTDEPQTRNASIYAQSYLERVATSSFPSHATRLRIVFQPIEMDLANASKLTSAVELFSTGELTPGQGLPGSPKHQPYDLDLALKHGGAPWSFWREWYQGFLDGKPLDWELQRRVALIPDEDWALGPEHIAEKIEKIRREFDGASRAPKRHEALEPRSVDRILQSRQISAAQLESAAQLIEDARCRYLNDTGANDLPKAFQPLPDVAQRLTTVAAVVRRHSDTGPVEQELREEIGRLNAQVLTLETELAKAQTAKDPVFWKAFKEQAGKSLGDWKLYGSLVGAVWFVSGDVTGLQERLENLGTLWRGFSEAVSSPSDTPIASPPLTTDV